MNPEQPNTDRSKDENLPAYADVSSHLFYDRYGVEHDSTQTPFPIDERFGVFAVLVAYDHILLNFPPWAQSCMEQGAHDQLCAELPGGGVDAGETALDALYRELYEETSLTLLADNALKPAYVSETYLNMFGEDVDTYFRYEQHFYYYDVSDYVSADDLKEKILTQEGSTAFWHSLDRLDELTLRFGHAHIIEQTAQHKCVADKIRKTIG